jgi:diguanylate cyclase (GGDEF)-like protein
MAIKDASSPSSTLRVVPPAADSEAAKRLASERRISLRLRLGTLLHSTLDLADLMQQFGREVERELAGAGLLYEASATAEPVHYGQSGRHRVSYQLEYDNLSLGKLECSRAKRFTERELERLEMMIGCLIPALRNAHRYQMALQSAVLDPMTSLGNRAGLSSAVDREIALAHRHRHPASLLVIDIDHFKHVNDTYGHSAGDAVLLEVSRVLREISRGSDALFRFGGEEFVALLPQTDAQGAAVIAERIRVAIAEHTTPYQDQKLYVTTSIGVAPLLKDDNLQSWFDRADRALYQAKQNGRDQVVTADATGQVLSASV